MLERSGQWKQKNLFRLLAATSGDSGIEVKLFKLPVTQIFDLGLPIFWFISEQLFDLIFAVRSRQLTNFFFN